MFPRCLDRPATQETQIHDRPTIVRTPARFHVSVSDSSLILTPFPPHAVGSDLIGVIARARGDDVDPRTLTTALLKYLEQAPQANRCAVHVAEGGAVDSALATMVGAPSQGLGWEAALFPESAPSLNERSRAVRALPKGCSLIQGTSHASLDQLSDLHRLSAGELASPHLAHEDSFTLFVDGEVRGWIPVRRLSPTTVTFRAVLHDGQLYSDEPRRRSFLRLTAWSQAAQIHLVEGTTVITWMPDNGDPINDYKLKVASPDWLVHWVTYVIEPPSLRLNA